MEEKDLGKLTATKLREIAKQYEEITGTHAMKKDELIIAIRRARGEDVTSSSVKRAPQKVGALKKKIKTLREEKVTSREKKDRKVTNILRKRIKKYRRLTRKMGKTAKTSEGQ